MSKISYPENETLNNLTVNVMNDTLKSLNSAINYYSYRVPNDFQYINALRDVGVRINNHINALNSIHSKIEGIDRAFTATMDSIDAMKDSLKTDVIDERDRLIK